MSVKSYQVTLLIDATAYAEVEAESAEQAYSIAADRAGHVTLCHQCTDEVETGDCYGAIVYSDDGENVEFTREAELESQLAALKEENAQLKARVAELEKEDTLWAMLDAIEKALFKKAAPHAWESVVTSAGMEFITSRRKTKEPANEG